MHKSRYDITHRYYRLGRLPKPQEALARAIVHSGKMRIDTGTESNFVRLLVPNERIDLTVTKREIAGPALHAKLRAILTPRHTPEQALTLAAHHINNTKADLAKRHPVSQEIELKLARALVLCNALPVITLIHLEAAEIFISFGQSVGEVMDVARWETMGSNSGLQAVGGGENAVYVSCGGHPFLTPNEYRHTGDGPPALARFLIIAAQETGHNGDMIRNRQGKWVGRHSATGWDRAPSAHSGPARQADIARTNACWSQCRTQGLDRIARWENNLMFYRKINVKNRRRQVAWLGSKLGWQVFKLLMRFRSPLPLPTLQRDAYPCNLLQTFFSDMLANLSPQAEVYHRQNPLEEEAIACIEATARVPQQVIKWGHKAVRTTTPALYDFYYSTIVPACEKHRQIMLQRSK